MRKRAGLHSSAYRSRMMPGVVWRGPLVGEGEMTNAAAAGSAAPWCSLCGATNRACFT